MGKRQACSGVTHQVKVPRLPGMPGIWVFVLLDMGFFALLFLAFVLGQLRHAELFAQSQRTLDVGLGLTNTLILLSSSWLVAFAVHAARDDDRKWSTRCLSLAILCGVSFVAIKVVEYSAKFRAGISILTNEFYMLYFAVTTLHLLHVIAGTTVLAVIAQKARNGGYGRGNTIGIETGATYWHMIDLLWVMIFPLFYLASWQ